MKTWRVVVAVVVLSGFAVVATAGGIPRSARLVKDAGNEFLSTKRYADAIDFYFKALELYPEFAEAHYNLAAALLKGYKAFGLARYHLEQYLELSPDADDRAEVEALADTLAERAVAPPAESGRVIAVVGGRLLVSGKGWARPGDQIEVAETGKAPCASLEADYIYPGAVLTQRIWDSETLEQVQPGLVVVGHSSAY